LTQSFAASFVAVDLSFCHVERAADRHRHDFSTIGLSANSYAALWCDTAFIETQPPRPRTCPKRSIMNAWLKS
jgi:hypothetical protein